MTDDRIESLERRRLDLKAKIADEISRPQPDELTLRRMKREKCRLKDEIARLRNEAQTQTSSAA